MSDQAPAIPHAGSRARRTRPRDRTMEALFPSLRRITQNGLRERWTVDAQRTETQRGRTPFADRQADACGGGGPEREFHEYEERSSGTYFGHRNLCASPSEDHPARCMRR